MLFHMPTNKAMQGRLDKLSEMTLVGIPAHREEFGNKKAGDLAWLESGQSIYNAV